jgi:inner membrane protein
MKIILMGLAIGIFSHDIGDMLTKGGIRGFFFPFFRNKTIGLLPKVFRFYTGTLTEYLVISVIIVKLLLVGFYYPKIIIH